MKQTGTIYIDKNGKYIFAVPKTLGEIPYSHFPGATNEGYQYMEILFTPQEYHVNEFITVVDENDRWMDKRYFESSHVPLIN